MRRPATPLDYWLWGVRFWCRTVGLQADWMARLRGQGGRALRPHAPGRPAPRGDRAEPRPAPPSAAAPGRAAQRSVAARTEENPQRPAPAPPARPRTARPRTEI